MLNNCILVIKLYLLDKDHLHKFIKEGLDDSINYLLFIK